MITSQEAQDSLYLMEITADLDVFEVNQKKVSDYISQQKRANKLLKLYMENYKPTFEDVVDLEIERLKQELGEMK